MLGRPLRPPPPDFPELFERHGWEVAHELGTNPRVVRRFLEECGRDELTKRRRNYVLGRRLSSLKLVGKPV